MTTCFIVLSLFGAFCTFNLYRPFSQTFALAMLSFAIAVLCGELALLFLGVQIIGVLLFVSCGAVQGMAATLALALTLLSWVALLNYFITAVHSADDLREQLNKWAGVESNSESRHFALIPARFSRDGWRWISRPFRVHLVDVTREVDVVYGEVNGLPLKLDVYTPKGMDRSTANAPVLLYFHGGGLNEKGGSKNRQGLPMLNDFASKGWVAVSINYRLSPTYQWPDHLVDCKTALHWIKQNIAGYGGNPDFVVTAGDSAGGQLSALMALTANKPEFQPELPEFDSRVQGTICCYAVMDFGNLYNTDFHVETGESWARDAIGHNLTPDEYERGVQSASPIANIQSDAAPMLVIHGDADTFVSVEQSRLFVRKLAAVAQNPVIYSDIKGAHHSFNILRSPRCEMVNLELIRFANELHNQWLNDKGLS